MRDIEPNKTYNLWIWSMVISLAFFVFVRMNTFFQFFFFSLIFVLIRNGLHFIRSYFSVDRGRDADNVHFATAG